MSSCQVFCPQAFGFGQEPFKLQILITADTGIRGSATGILADKIIHHLFLKIFIKIQNIMFYPQLMGHPAGVFYALNTTAGRPFFTGLLEAKAHRNPDDLITFPLQKARGHRRIHPPGHRHHYFYLHTQSLVAITFTPKPKRFAAIISPILTGLSSLIFLISPAASKTLSLGIGLSVLTGIIFKTNPRELTVEVKILRGFSTSETA